MRRGTKGLLAALGVAVVGGAIALTVPGRGAPRPADPAVASSVGADDAAKEVDARLARRRALASRIKAAGDAGNDVTGVRYRPQRPGHDEDTEDFRRNLWEELDSYAEEARLTPEQRARFLDDLADLAEALRAEMDRDLAGRVIARGYEEIRADSEQQLEERMQYLSDAQWQLFMRRFRHYGTLVQQLAIMEVLEREPAPDRPVASTR
jgi:hypothetical protein